MPATHHNSTEVLAIQSNGDPDFDRLGQCMEEAGNRDIYVSVLRFESYCVKWIVPTSDSWSSHPFHCEKSVNGVDGHFDGDGRSDVYPLESDEVLMHQGADVRKPIETVNEHGYRRSSPSNALEADTRRRLRNPQRTAKLKLSGQRVHVERSESSPIRDQAN